MPFKVTKDGVAITIRLRPGASANRIDGIRAMADGGQRLYLQVTAVAEKGEANQAMIKLLAKACRVPRGKLVVVAGAKGRNKTVLLRGGERADLEMLKNWSRETR